MEFKKGNHNIYLGNSEQDYSAIIEYKEVGDSVLDVYHTLVKPELEGQGIAGKLVEEIVKYARENNYKLVGSCSYADHKFKTVKEYQDVVK